MALTTIASLPVRSAGNTSSMESEATPTEDREQETSMSAQADRTQRLPKRLTSELTASMPTRAMTEVSPLTIGLT